MELSVPLSFPSAGFGGQGCASGMLHWGQGDTSGFKDKAGGRTGRSVGAEWHHWDPGASEGAGLGAGPALSEASAQKAADGAQRGISRRTLCLSFLCFCIV